MFIWTCSSGTSCRAPESEPADCIFSLSSRRDQVAYLTPSMCLCDCSAQEHTFIKQPPTDPVMLAQMMTDPVPLYYLQDDTEYVVESSPFLGTTVHATIVDGYA